MLTRDEFGSRELFAQIVTDMAKAIADRDDEPAQQRQSRARAVVDIVSDVRPRDAIETMIAGHCIIFHEMILDSLRDTGLGDLTARAKGRSTVVAMNKAFQENLRRLEHFQARPSDEQDARVADQAEDHVEDVVHAAENLVPAAENLVPAAEPTPPEPDREAVEAEAPAGVSVHGLPDRQLPSIKRPAVRQDVSRRDTSPERSAVTNAPPFKDARFAAMAADTG
jgi:hypothetical protein